MKQNKKQKVEGKQLSHAFAKLPVRRGITICDCRNGVVKIGDKVIDPEGRHCWIKDWFDGIVEVDYRIKGSSVTGQYYRVYLA